MVGNSTTQKTCLESEDESLSLIAGHLCKKGQTGNLWDATGTRNPIQVRDSAG